MISCSRQLPVLASFLYVYLSASLTQLVLLLTERQERPQELRPTLVEQAKQSRMSTIYDDPLALYAHADHTFCELFDIGGLS